MKFENLTELEVLRYAYDSLLEGYFSWKVRAECCSASEYDKQMKSLFEKKLNEIGSKIYELETKGLR